MELHEDGRPIVRFSLFEAWWKDPQKAMRQYFPAGAQGYTNKYMQFGSRVAEGLCERPVPDWLQGITHYDVNEYRIILDIDGFMVRGTLDSYDTARNKFLDHKCAKVKRLKDGTWSAHSWTTGKVHKHIQLVFYSLLVQLQHGTVDDECHISVIPVCEGDDGIICRTGAPSEELVRVIRQHERDEMRTRIVGTARDITRMYEEYTNGLIII